MDTKELDLCDILDYVDSIKYPLTAVYVGIGTAVHTTITDWKTDTIAPPNGGTTNGNVTISTPTTIGPRKIIGNLTINAELTIANTIYVTGNVLINNNVRLSSSYGASSGIMIADGYIDIAGGVNFYDSGTTGSYILLLSTQRQDF